MLGMVELGSAAHGWHSKSWTLSEGVAGRATAEAMGRDREMPLLPGLEVDKRTWGRVPGHKLLPAFGIYSRQVLLFPRGGR